MKNTEMLSHPLAPLTSWHIGGPAERFYSPPDIPALAHYMQTVSSDTPITWLGLGSNVLIRDSGIKGVVIASRQLQTLSHQDSIITAQAGVTCAKLARLATQCGFPQGAFFAGIPGTVGGALAMNAGAFGGETWEFLKSVHVMNRKGECFYRDASEYTIGYRSVKGKKPEQADEVFLGAQWHFHPLPQNTMPNIKELLRKRAETQPIGTWNCGSVYRNPPGDFAARLIEAAQLKGVKIGDAMISEKHANFIINCGNARASDVEALMAIIQSEVHARFGILLQTEVRILGDA